MALKNENLHAAMKLYVVAAINLVREQAFSDANHNDLNDQTFFFAKIAATNRLRGIPEYKHCKQTLTAEETLSKQLGVLAGPRGGPRFESADADGLMLQLLDLGLRPGQFTFDEAHFEKEYADLEKAYYDREIEYYALAPLNGFVPSTPISLSNKIEIIELQEEEVAPTTEERRSRPANNSWMEKLYAVRIRYSLPKAIGQTHTVTPQDWQDDHAIQTAVNQQIGEVVTALRLCGIESVYVPGVLHKASKWSFGQNRPFPGQFQPETRFSMTVDLDWLHRFAEFWRSLQTEGVQKRQFLVTAIRRFGFAHERYRTEDKIIDLLVAAEALLLSDGSYTGEVKYRLTQRIAIFLATTRDDRKTIFSRMRVAYDLRSTVAHGGRYKKQLPKKGDGTVPTTDEFVWQIQEYVRIAVIKSVQLANQTSGSGSLLNWDDLCLDGSTIP
jgi:hypothetical protein